MKTTVLKCASVAILLLFTLSAFSQDADWNTNYAKAVEQAKTQSKPILLDFTGSDWCGWCIKMKEETLDKPMFRHYAKKHLVLVELDFPHNKKQKEDVKTQNQQLKQQYKASGFPTFVLVDKDGKELGRQVGYLEGGPAAFIAKLNTLYKPAPDSANKSGGDDFDKLFKKPSPLPTP